MTTDMPSSAYTGFLAAMKDADLLFRLYERERLSTPSPPDETEVLKRATVILLVAGWETFIEDFLRERFTPLLKAAEKPADVQAAFTTVAEMWSVRPKDQLLSSLDSWTGEGWKAKILEHFENQLRTFNSPNAKNCGRLFKLFLDVDLKTVWKWGGHSYEQVAKKLDDIILLRGTVAHTARKAVTGSPVKHSVSRQTLDGYMKFIREIAATTDGVM